MKRRQFFTSVIAGGIAVPVFGDDRGHGGHGKMDGPLSNATMNFGAWQSSPAPFDRFPNASANTINRNLHRLTPNEVKIKVGGTVNFIISGFHNIQIFEPGTTVEFVKAAAAVAGGTTTVANPPGPPIVNVATGRVYRGLDPSTIPRLVTGGNVGDGNLQDRVEAVQLTEKGRYLVLCGVLPHLNDNMFGFIRVVDDDDD